MKNAEDFLKLGNVVYHRGAAVYMVPRKDPYALANFGYVFQYSHWKITDENTTSPITIVSSTVDFWWKNLTDTYFRVRSTDNRYAIHRAADFYFNGSHAIRTWRYDSGIRIRSLSTKDEYGSGYFTYSQNADAFILIYKNDPDNMNKAISTVLHELGHFTHFGEQGAYTGSAYDGLKAVQGLLRESFASYVGFYLGELYYTSVLGYRKPSADFQITTQGRQKWRKTYSDEYSPLFVDLIDDFDQHTLGEQYNIDHTTTVH